MRDRVLLRSASPATVTVNVEQRLDAAPADLAWPYDVAIVGLGYVGLPTALAFHAAGLRVLGVDINEHRLADIRSGAPDLLGSDRARLTSAGSSAAWELSSDLSRVNRARTVIVCVPTPVNAHSVPDLRALRGASAAVVAEARPGQLLMLTSTSYAGCTRDLVVGPLEARGLRVGIDVHVAYSPERINPAVESFSHEDVPRVVGGATRACGDVAVAVLQQYVRSTHLVESLEVAELTKLLENTFRAVNIAFINEFAAVCSSLDVPVSDVIDAAATKPFGFTPFRPGPGVGGHCIPCDPHYLLWQLKADQTRAPILEEAMSGLSQRPRFVASRVRELLADAGTRAMDARVVVIGVAYKPNVSDVRESTALEVISRLRTAGVEVEYVDAHVPSIRLRDSTQLRSIRADDIGAPSLILVHTRHDSFDLDSLPKHARVLDATYTLAQSADCTHL